MSVSPVPAPARPEPPAALRLGEILVRQGAITADQLTHALARQPSAGGRIGRLVVALQFASDESVQRAVALRHGVPFVDLDRASPDRALARLINRAWARRHRVLPVACRGRVLTVAMIDPDATDVADELRRLTGFTVDVVTSTDVAMQRAFRRLYDDALDAASPPPASPSTAGDAGAAVDAMDAATSHRADDLLRRLLRHALAARCSDLHLEMLNDGLSVRYRIDGVLRPPHFGDLHESLDRGAREIVSRVKVLARLDIAERRRPQDGSFRFAPDAARAAFDLRVSILPTHSGESVVLRLLDGSRAPQSLEALDVTPPVADRLSRVLTRSSGIFLVTGPTGSGKSTTLYACLRRLHHPGIRVLTAEDPVEYVYDGLSQCEVNDEIGNTFARYLRAFLRHDPEVIMVGEIRDEDTARMAFRAAQTGHLLLSTLHTNTAASAVTRLLDLGIERSLVAGSLAGVMSQRLVRRVCAACRRPADPASGLVSEFFPAGHDGAARCVRASGCAACAFTGYAGRLIVAEFWMPDDADAALIGSGAPFDEIRRSAARATHPMIDDARWRLSTAATTAEEIQRVLPQILHGPLH